MIVFADTSALFALLASDDRMHFQARSDLERLKVNDAVLITSSCVLVETSSLVQNRLGMEAAVDFHQNISPLLQTVWVDEQWHSNAVRRLLALQRKNVSLVDCLSFVIMESKQINTAYSYDKHFREQGFTLLSEAFPFS